MRRTVVKSQARSGVYFSLCDGFRKFRVWEKMEERETELMVRALKTNNFGFNWVARRFLI